MLDLENYAGRRIEIELDGRHLKGQVVRGPGRKPVLLEELGQVGSERSDAHKKLTMLKTWTRRQLEGATFVAVLPSVDKPSPPKRRRKAQWSETVAIAEGDPATPPKDWEGGVLAWAEAVHAARRKVDRSRKAMMQALHEAAG